MPLDQIYLCVRVSLCVFLLLSRQESHEKDQLRKKIICILSVYLRGNVCEPETPRSVLDIHYFGQAMEQ